MAAHSGDRAPWYAQVTAVVLPIVAVSSVILTLVYWTLIHRADLIGYPADQILRHGVNFALVAFDIMLSAAPYPLLHAVFVVGFACVYVLWSAIYHAAGLTRDCECPTGGSTRDCTELGDEPFADECRNIYDFLSWHFPGAATAYMFGIFFIAIVFHVLFHLVVAPLRRCQSIGDEDAPARGCCAALRSEFSLARASPDAGPSWIEQHASSPIIKWDHIWLALRTASALLTFYIVIDIFVGTDNPPLQLIFLTTWSNIMGIPYFVCAAYTTYAAQRERTAIANDKPGTTSVPSTA